MQEWRARVDQNCRDFGCEHFRSVCERSKRHRVHQSSDDRYVNGRNGFLRLQREMHNGMWNCKVLDTELDKERRPSIACQSVACHESAPTCWCLQLHSAHRQQLCHLCKLESPVQELGSWCSECLVVFHRLLHISCPSTLLHCQQNIFRMRYELFMNQNHLKLVFIAISPAHCLIEFNQELKVANFAIVDFAFSATKFTLNCIFHHWFLLLLCVLINEIKKFIFCVAIGVWIREDAVDWTNRENQENQRKLHRSSFDKSPRATDMNCIKLWEPKSKNLQN